MRSIIIIAGLCLAFADLFPHYADKAMSARPAPTPAAMVATPAPSSAGSRTVVIPHDRRGHFQVDARLDGQRMGFMVDTGASVIALNARGPRAPR